MNILAKYTRRALSRNKTRTLVTIIGIVLSMALFTAVIEGAWSGLSFLIRAEVETSGSYMVIVPPRRRKSGSASPPTAGLRATP
ncbi:MAG: hypothetical protein IIT95_05450, partial [Oscillospiraceae bacterium]|nr:hypothetical protein [Oscillospiraceae bacterium]